MQDLYLQLQNLKRTDKYCLIFIAALLLCMAIKILATDPLQYSINTSRELLEEKQQNLNNYLAFAEQYKDYCALQKQQNEAALLANELLPPQITTAELIKEYTALLRLPVNITCVLKALNLFRRKNRKKKHIHM